MSITYDGIGTKTLAVRHHLFPQSECSEVIQITLVIASNLGDGIAAELLQKSIGNLYGHYRLGNH